jgi:hypothetical protein
MDLLDYNSKDLVRSVGDASTKLFGIMLVQPIQRASQVVIVEHLGVNPCSQQVLDWFVDDC